MLKKEKKINITVFISTTYLVLSILEVVIAVALIGIKGISSFFVIETALMTVVTSIVLAVVLIKFKLKKKLLLVNLLLVLVGLIAVFAQFIAPTLATTMPHKYFTIGASHAVYYRIDLMQGTTIPNAILSIQKSYYKININFIISICMFFINMVFLFNRRKKHASI